MDNPLVQPDPGLFFWTIATFLVLLFLLAKFAWKPLLQALESRQEMIQKTGQMLQPCVEIDGQMLADVSGEEVEAYMLANSIVETNNLEADAPTNQPCENEMQGSDITFR